jgi:hypothetical protein
METESTNLLYAQLSYDWTAFSSSHSNTEVYLDNPYLGLIGRFIFIIDTYTEKTELIQQPCI